MQPEDDRMLTDDVEPTQQQTQATQGASQAEQPDLRQVWGHLVPCSSSLRRLDLVKSRTVYRIGRNREGMKNDIILPGMKISNFHAIIEWDGDDSPKCSVKITDLSSNGTFINGEKIGKGNYKILRDGNEVAFGTASQQHANSGLEDYRFMFRNLCLHTPDRGLHSKYDLQHELGRGSFATVMKALHRKTGEWYAVKIIQASKLRRGFSGASVQGLQADDKASNFAREINILERLQHRNICQLKEVFLERYNINLVLEWVDGGDLLDYILRRNGISEAEAAHLTYQICDALAYVHDLGICHRDLKPENVLLTADDPPIVKVADFGLAKVIDSMTMLRTMCGTPAYLAPEVVMQTNDQGYDQIVDSWSVGVIVFCMLAMCNPFEDDTTLEIKERVAQRKVEWPLLYQRNEPVSPACRDFLERLLEPDPTRRMSLADARMHPWLSVQYTQHVQKQARERTSSATPVPMPPRAAGAGVGRAEMVDASMRSVAADGDDEENMALDAPASGRLTPPPDPAESSASEASDEEGAGPSQRLRRRVDVIRRAKHRGEELPSPSQEMRARAAAEDPDFADDDGDRDDEGNEENVAPMPAMVLAPAGPSRANKRKAAASANGGLAPVDEDAMVEDDGTPAPRTRASATPARRGVRGSARKVTPATPPPARRGRRTANGNGHANGVEEDAGAAAGGPRRSTRLSHSSPSKVVKAARRT